MFMARSPALLFREGRPGGGGWIESELDDHTPGVTIHDRDLMEELVVRDG
jgi:hypothetical protein